MLAPVPQHALPRLPPPSPAHDPPPVVERLDVPPGTAVVPPTELDDAHERLAAPGGSVVLAVPEDVLSEPDEDGEEEEGAGEDQRGEDCQGVARVDRGGLVVGEGRAVVGEDELAALLMMSAEPPARDGAG